MSLRDSLRSPLTARPTTTDRLAIGEDEALWSAALSRRPIRAVTLTDGLSPAGHLQRLRGLVLRLPPHPLRDRPRHHLPVHRHRRSPSDPRSVHANRGTPIRPTHIRRQPLRIRQPRSPPPPAPAAPPRPGPPHAPSTSCPSTSATPAPADHHTPGSPGRAPSPDTTQAPSPRRASCGCTPNRSQFQHRGEHGNHRTSRCNRRRCRCCAGDSSSSLATGPRDRLRQVLRQIRHPPVRVILRLEDPLQVHLRPEPHHVRRRGVLVRVERVQRLIPRRQHHARCPGRRSRRRPATPAGPPRARPSSNGGHHTWWYVAAATSRTTARGIAPRTAACRCGASRRCSSTTAKYCTW